MAGSRLMWAPGAYTRSTTLWLSERWNGMCFKLALEVVAFFVWVGASRTRLIVRVCGMAIGRASWPLRTPDLGCGSRPSSMAGAPSSMG